MTLDDFRNADMFDSRDMIERIDELEAIVDGPRLTEQDEGYTDEMAALEELDALRAFESENEGGDWSYGATFIADDHFEDYARELAEDIGAIPDDAGWPCTCIDWEHAARELRYDYTSAELDGATFWTRG
jgi:antirestriction protein